MPILVLISNIILIILLSIITVSSIYRAYIAYRRPATKFTLDEDDLKLVLRLLHNKATSVEDELAIDKSVYEVYQKIEFSQHVRALANSLEANLKRR